MTSKTGRTLKILYSLFALSQQHDIIKCIFIFDFNIAQIRKINQNKSTMASIWREKMLGYLSADNICSEMRTIFRA